MTDLFSPDAKWIWLAQPQRDKNSYACFRRTLDLREVRPESKIHFTADARYELWVNGHFVGHGPTRSWRSPWPVDEYDLTKLLAPGKNAIAVLVTHFGISTFQYLHDAPGLIAQIDLPGGTRIVTDSSWKSSPHGGYLWPVPRITCQQAWEEQFDARTSPGLPQEWSSAAFDDASWPQAKELPGGHPSHKQFEPREIPMLTREPTPPVAIVAIDVVRPADYSFALNPREFVNATDKTMNHMIARMLLATYIQSDRAQKIDLHLPHTRPLNPWKLNGEPLKFEDHSLQKTDTGVAHAQLKEGWNTLMVRLPESEHHYWANLNIWTEHSVTFSHEPSQNQAAAETNWLAIGPFSGAPDHPFDEVVIGAERIEPAATGQRFEKIWSRGVLSDAERKEPFVRPMRRDMVATQDIYAICVSDRAETSVTPRVENGEALLSDDDGWATIHPAHDGAGVRVLFDFGREVIGFQEFEIDASSGGAGAIVDFHNFEFIQKDGRFNLCESMNNSFRYVCRDGVQQYKTFLRRGFKYSWMTLRDFHQPVKVRGVRVLMSTYPPTGVGSFECSDEKLNQIWRVGVHSVRCCSEDTYTDCPTYEQTLWVGDARNEALVDLIANGDPRLSARCLRLTGRSLQRSSIAESQVPSGWQNLLPTWTFLWMRWTQEHYQLTGDKAFGREMLAFLDRNIAGMKKEINKQGGRGLFAMFGWNLFDWAPMDTPGNGIVTHINCLASLGLKQSAQLARDVGDEVKASDWDSLAKRLADATNEHLWSDQKQAYVDCIRADGTLSPVFSQQTQTAAYISGVAAGDRATRCGEIVHNPPADFVKAGSPFFMFFLLEALVREGRFDEMIETIRSYWGKQIDAGATTFWEMYHDGGPADGNKRLTRSHCHGWSAAPTFFLTQHVLGVQPLEAGYAKVLIAPKLGSLTWARGKVPSPAGAIECSWKRGDGVFELTADVPRGSAMQIELPVQGDVKILEGDGTIAGATIISPGPRLRISLRA